MTVRTILGASALVATCVACSSSNKPAQYPSTKGLTPSEARDMTYTSYERQAPIYEKALAERDRLWRKEEK